MSLHFLRRSDEMRAVTPVYEYAACAEPKVCLSLFCLGLGLEVSSSYTTESSASSDLDDLSFQPTSANQGLKLSAFKTYYWINSPLLALSELWPADSTQLSLFKLLFKLIDSNRLHVTSVLLPLERMPLNCSELCCSALNWAQLHWTETGPTEPKWAEPKSVPHCTFIASHSCLFSWQLGRSYLWLLCLLIRRFFVDFPEKASAQDPQDKVLSTKEIGFSQGQREGIRRQRQEKEDKVEGKATREREKGHFFQRAKHCFWIERRQI